MSKAAKASTMTDERSLVWWQAEALRLQRALDAVLPRPQVCLPLPEVPEPTSGAAPSRTNRYVRLTARELATLELVYVELLSGGRFARVLPASYDPLPADESEVDDFIARRTEEWREGLARRLERIFMRHDRRERVVRALEGKLLPYDDDDDDPGETP